MKTASPAPRCTAVVATLLLHAALIATALSVLTSQNKKIILPRPVTIELLHERLTPSAALPMAPPQPPQKKRLQSEPRPAFKPTPQPREPSPPEAKAPAAPFEPKPAPSNSTAAPAPAPPAPVKTGVSIPASYAASNRKPPYPRLSRQSEEEGTVGLRILVKADGTAGAVEIASSSGYPLLDESARSTVQTWHFNPATVDGKAVAEWYRVSIPFKLQN